MTWGLLLLVALGFTYLNLEKRLLLKWLGDGCEAGAKTNWISLGTGGALLSLLLTLTLGTLAPVSRPVRTVLEPALVFLGLALPREFPCWNWWL